MNRPRKLTASRVRELLDIDPNAGTLTWKPRPEAKPNWNARYAGKPAGSVPCKDGYRRIGIDGRRYLVHRVIFLHEKGYWPPAFLDHADGNRANNSIGNLRPVSMHQNNMNLRRASKKGFPRGCWQDPKTGRWQVHIQAYGKRRCVGWFESREAAERAYRDAAVDLHREFSVAERRAAA